MNINYIMRDYIQPPVLSAVKSSHLPFLLVQAAWENINDIISSFIQQSIE